MKKINILVIGLLITLMTNSTSIFAQNCTGFKTLTQGGWGANCNGNNGGCTLDSKFATVFPKGLTIGCNNRTITFSSPSEIRAFLPSGGAPSILPLSMNDPVATYSNTLAGQLVALTLNIQFDATIPGYSLNSMNLRDLYITTGIFAGVKVGDFLILANKVAGGCITNYTPSDVNNAATSINQNYDNGIADDGFLTCTSPFIPLLVDIKVNSNNLCFGQNIGSASANIQGGTPPYNFLWSEGSITKDLNGLATGEYSVTVTDAAGQSSTASATITGPDELLLYTNVTDVSCFNGTDGQISTIVTGGTSPYTFEWSTTDNTLDLTDLSAGIYDLFITDANGCSTQGSAVVNQPERLSTVYQVKDVACYNGSDGNVNLTTTGGVSPYSYLWANASNLSMISNLVAGLYTATITDANGCQDQVSATVNQPQAISINYSVKNVSCFNGSDGNINLNIQGGSGSYIYLWSNLSLKSNITGLKAGSYSVTVTDSNGCFGSVKATVNQPDELKGVMNINNVSCFNGNNGSISVIASGGVSPYMYNWSNNSTLPVINNLTAGIYTLSLNDANGCIANLQGNVNQPSPLSMTIGKSGDVKCFGGTSSAEVEIYGGKAPYSATWNTNPLQTGISATLPVGSWTVSVNDANGCAISGSISMSIVPCSGFVTATMGGWGAKCSGNNLGCYRNTYFSSSFPTGLIVGSGSNILKFSSAAAIQGFLPSSGTPRPLFPGLMVNPTSATFNNSLAGQAVALTLNVVFDQNNPSFAPSTSNLSSLIMTTGTFTGWTVKQILAEANKVLGGQPSPYSASTLTTALDLINRNYDSGSNLGNLACACQSRTFTPSDNSSEIPVADNTVSFDHSLMAYPNPFSTNTVIQVSLGYDSEVELNLYNINGQLMATIFKGSVNAGETNAYALEAGNNKPGIYFIKLITQKGVYNSKLILTK